MRGAGMFMTVRFMGVTAQTLANKKHTGSASNTGTPKRQKNCGRVRGAACNLSGRCMGVTIRAHVNKPHTENARRERWRLKNWLFLKRTTKHTGTARGESLRLSCGFLGRVWQWTRPKLCLLLGARMYILKTNKQKENKP